MTPLVWAFTLLAMLAFSANSLLARAAFSTTTIDPASFTAIRLAAGALTLFVILRCQGGKPTSLKAGGWSAFMLFVYAAAFSFAYRDISTGAGALVLFASAQLLMISYGLFKGERASILGLLCALGGLAAFLAPSASAPPVSAAALMAVAGFAWGAFSLLGRSQGAPIVSTTSSFIWALPLVAVLILTQLPHLNTDAFGVTYALLSGCVASGLGYAVWYWVRVRMTAIGAGAVQLSVPVISALMGLALLDESMSVQSAVAALVTLGGVAWVTLTIRRPER
ncbi:DMT family transporter [Pusillimonas minor]|uniref:DMT family transporter n=1 Tax=Pusillimonas minor TaxID=2697024 RepID=A0A842HLY6_9BURK|nr:DMT family transporter [Pusillimonas minor]MBC2768350.1 DMT family transporter [Pusillimonas minor]